jgi:ligand-binding SRPBCC domain-containing protein
MAHTSERAIGGKTSGLIGMGEEVTWEGRHFGVLHTHTSRITRFDCPRHFRDEMIRGRFRRFVHDHYFEPATSGTRMLDVLEFNSPWGPLGWIVDNLVLTKYLRRLLQERNTIVRRAAESEVESEADS